MLSAAMGTAPDLLLQIYLELNTVVRKVVHICNPRLWRLGQEGKKVKTRINYMIATNFKRKIKIKTIWENRIKQIRPTDMCCMLSLTSNLEKTLE